MDIDQLLEQVISPYQGQQEPTSDQARIAILALRNASTKANAQLGAASEEVASAIGDYAQAASDYADALNTEANAGSQSQAEAAFDAARASATAACSLRTPLRRQ
ncbi:hypothetical protein Srot_2696 [Segniliparus rotundus DSM 44985]|uniref:Uncharacterized protein n=2 Tax=Segniliparus rotundus TaxID=286802 RepID=D6ZCG1_SEGRD|nr:hypothetical protein Srot_2696 [Segniliparus rotundus DSM 44985]